MLFSFPLSIKRGKERKLRPIPVGTYQASDMFIKYDSASDQLIVDHNNNEVTQNYAWIIEEFNLEIQKDDV
ncbi:MAG: hypothetical protein IKY43_06615, partial [Bacteroidales bacterium]|nr:hypothetical protein [Bacteroidales bacterium]